MRRRTLTIDMDSEAARTAREFGIDLTLTEQLVNITPTERLKRLQKRIGQIQRLRDEK